MVRITLCSWKELSGEAGCFAVRSGSKPMATRSEGTSLLSTASPHAGSSFSHQLIQHMCCYPVPDPDPGTAMKNQHKIPDAWSVHSNYRKTEYEQICNLPGNGEC